MNTTMKIAKTATEVSSVNKEELLRLRSYVARLAVENFDLTLANAKLTTEIEKRKADDSLMQCRVDDLSAELNDVVAGKDAEIDYLNDRLRAWETKRMMAAEYIRSLQEERDCLSEWKRDYLKFTADALALLNNPPIIIDADSLGKIDLDSLKPYGKSPAVVVTDGLYDGFDFT